MSEKSALKRLVIVTPVYNDWESFKFLVRDIEVAMRDGHYSVEILAIDDCSTEAAPSALETSGFISGISVVRLAANVGHQRAIAIGLVQAAKRDDVETVAVLDSDGEDRPTELRAMADIASNSPEVTVVAERKKRSEGLVFKAFYKVYTHLFGLLTGKLINFGNFSVLPMAHVRRLVHNPNMWNHFAASIVHMRLPLRYVGTVRGRRYAGSSKMNFVALILHGLGAISVFSDAVFVRVLIFSSIALVLSVSGAGVVLGIRLFSDLAVPGWATTVLGLALLVSMQAVMMPIMLAFLLLNSRASIQALPKDHAANLIERSHAMTLLTADKHPEGVRC
jgi:glycosyltransferase involved in cell wall biosynthesis